MNKDEALQQLRAENTALYEQLQRQDQELTRSLKANQDLREGLKQAIIAIEHLYEHHFYKDLSGTSSLG